MVEETQGNSNQNGSIKPKRLYTFQEKVIGMLVLLMIVSLAILYGQSRFNDSQAKFNLRVDDYMNYSDVMFSRLTNETTRLGFQIIDLNTSVESKFGSTYSDMFVLWVMDLSKGKQESVLTSLNSLSKTDFSCIRGYSGVTIYQNSYVFWFTSNDTDTPTRYVEFSSDGILNCGVFECTNICGGFK